MNPRFKYRRIQPREDITEIKTKCNQDSVCMKDVTTPDYWNTTYHDDYIKYPNAKRDICPPPPTSISLCGGCLAPTREEMRSSYMNTYHAFDKVDIPPIAIPPPNSEVIPRDYIPPVMSTAQEEMLHTSQIKRSPVDVQSARDMASYQKANHFSAGFDRPSYTTTTASSYSARGRIEPMKYDNRNIGSHIEFDKIAGLGPHEKSLSKRRWAPPKPDSAVFDQNRTNFDFGYNKLDYSTTTQSSFYKDRLKPPPRADPPPCAEFSNHEPHVPKWRTHYQAEFKHRKPIPNEIDKTDLQKTHWDTGYDKPQWPVHEPPPTTRREKHSKNLQESNIVFKGDGTMQFNTTTGDMIGNYDKSLWKPVSSDNDSRRDNIYIGADRTNYQTTVQHANELAGTGKPADIIDDFSKHRPPAFAKGGNWDQFANTKDMVDIKRYKPVSPTVRQDGSYYKQTHFELEATKDFKPRYSTTYYRTICKPTLQT
ncbi:hypothetical protein TRFO_30449 [Tritrichomonas foetus]|uniref:Uncharacterized protein n=1 Tax=Tritrichomonas foetus TaxID=1144522 RepID=A0A1J4JTK2_9EUKA|nr:hypothetical protein TRFO_30449 [Tritrichomonas foetus]|eukprot:OHT02447.1 hypothetical protein TRFO_30449 [Tritrichomonas foetus]